MHSVFKHPFLDLDWTQIGHLNIAYYIDRFPATIYSMFPRPIFNKHVSQALADLFDTVALDKNPLCACLPETELGRMASPGRALQRSIIQGIESLKPGSDIPTLAVQWRIYHLLQLRYVEGMLVKEIMNRLQLGDRQLRRDNQRAIAALASLLWDIWFAVTETAPPDEFDYVVTSGFDVKSVPLDLHDFFANIFSTLQSMPASNWQNITLHLPEELPFIQSDRVLMRHAFITCLYKYLSGHADRQVNIAVRLEDQLLFIDIEGSDSLLVWEDSEIKNLDELFHQINGHLRIRSSDLVLELPFINSRQILIIDDDNNTIHLFKRYLTGLPYSIITAQDSSKAVKLAEQLQPDLIILDVLLPEVDGWEILQVLKADPLVRKVPVIVCSAWNEPEIAISLGADFFLHKNVLQKDLLAAIQKYLP